MPVVIEKTLVCVFDVTLTTNTPLCAGGASTTKTNHFMKLLLLQLLLLPALLSAQNPYKITKVKAAGFATVAAASLVDGILEGYQFDGRRSFERKWGSDPRGFWGSESWRANHTWYAKTMGVPDFYHMADDTRKIGYITGGVMIGIGMKDNRKWWHYALDIGISAVVSAGAKHAGMSWVRN